MDNNSTNFHNIVDNIEHDQVKKSMILLKQKMCKTDNLIKKYCENIKEINHLKYDLDVAKKETKHNISNYTSAMDKIRELELKNVNDKKNNERLVNKISEYEITIDANEKTFQQLNCKIKVLEDEHAAKLMEYNLQKSSFEDKIKDLESELKKLKSVSKKREKTKISADFDTTKTNIGTKSSSDIGINVSLCDNQPSTKCEVQDKNIMTDEFYNMKDDPHPLFCAKCETHLSPDETPEEIYKTMTAYPKLIENLSSSPPKKIYSPPRLLSNPTNKNEGALSRISFMSHRPYSPYNDLTIGNSKSGRSSAMTQISENVEFRNVHTPIVNQSSSILPTFTLSQNRNRAREDLYSDDLIAKHSLSIKELERKIRSLKSKVKKLGKLKEKVDISSCRCSCKNDISLNSNLISIICKSVAEYYSEKREICSTHEQNIDSEKCTCCAKKTKLERRQHSICARENTFSQKIENIERYQERDIFCNKTETTTDTLQSTSEDILPVHENNTFLNMNTSNMSLNDIDESDKREFYEEQTVLHEKNTLHSAELACAEDNLTMSRCADKVYASEDHLLNKDNLEVLSIDNQLEIACADDKIVDINAEERKIKRKGQNVHKGKIGERLLKNIRNLKRKSQVIPRINKHENVESSLEHISECSELPKKLRIENEEETDDMLENVRNLKRNLNLQEKSMNKQEDDKLCSNQYEPAKKLRIAHTPKIVSQSSINENDSTHCVIRNMATLLVTRQKDNGSLIKRHIDTRRKDNLLIENKKSGINNKCDEKNVVDSIETNSTDGKFINEKDLTSAKDCLRNNDTLPVTNIEQVFKIEVCDDVSVEDRSNTVSVNGVKGETSNNEANMIQDNIANDTAHNTELEESIPLETSTQSELSILCKNSKYDKFTEALETETGKETTPIIELEHAYALFGNKSSNDHKTSKDVILSDESSVLHGRSKTIKVRTKNARVSQQDKETEFMNISYDEESQAPMSRLIKFINKNRVKNSKLPIKKLEYIRKITDDFVKKQLHRLINNTWENSIHEDILEKLGSTCGPRVIAKCILEFLMEEVNHSDDLDKSFTPPAPPMTTFEQKIVTLLIDLEVLKPMVIYFVLAAIEYHLFRLNSDVQAEVDSFTRIYVVLSRIQKDRERVRMMCCNALYCMGLKSIRVLYTILTSWTEVLPNAEETNKGILPKCISFLISSQIISNSSESKRSLFQKLYTLKSLLRRYYNYTFTQETIDILNEVMTALKAERTDGLDTAIILLAKREGSSWTYKNIIQSALLPMILKNEHPCTYSAFALLGRLLRAFPSQDEDNTVQEIGEQLRDLMQSGEGSHDQQEGVVSALLSLSRHKFHIALSIMTWMPSKSLRPVVDMQLQAFIEGRKSTFWKNYLKKSGFKPK